MAAEAEAKQAERREREEDGVVTATDPGGVATDDAVSTLLEAEALEQADPLASRCLLLLFSTILGALHLNRISCPQCQRQGTCLCPVPATKGPVWAAPPRGHRRVRGNGFRFPPRPHLQWVRRSRPLHCGPALLRACAATQPRGVWIASRIGSPPPSKEFAEGGAGSAQSAPGVGCALGGRAVGGAGKCFLPSRPLPTSRHLLPTTPS